jgi:response regulator RpfG family c-di-GMP phosphodiesterase
VLIVDPDPATMRAMEDSLRSAGVEVFKAADGEEAIRAVLVEKPQVIFADWSMSEMSGPEFCRVLRALPNMAFLYIIAVLPDAQDDRAAEAVDAGADDFLPRPWKPQELRTRLQAALRITQLEMDDKDRRNCGVRNAVAGVTRYDNRSDSNAGACGDGGSYADAALQTPPKVLIVDDDRAIRMLCKRLLEKSGYAVAEAVDGVDALAKVAEEHPDVIVLDGMMPNMNGADCARRLKADPTTREIPIVMASAAGEEQDIVAGLEAGVDEYITKPIRHREFVLRVRSMAHLYRSKLELMQTCRVRDAQANALAMLLDYSASLSVSRNLDTVLEKTVSVAARLLDCRRVSIMLPDVETDSLRIVRSVGIDPDLAANVRVPKGGEIAGRVFASKEPVVMNDHPEPESDATRYDSAFFASVPLISHPLIGPEHTIGVLNMTERKRGHAFEPRELKYIQLISSIAAATIDDIVTRRARDEARDSIVGALATLAEYRDTDTGRHLDRVTKFSRLLADRLREKVNFARVIDDEFLYALERAVPLHDIGKVAIPDNILLKPGKLDPDEMRHMRRHAAIGAQAIRSVINRAPGVDFLLMAEEIAGCHHEWYDGTGYPGGLRGEEIPLSARIAALADVYDALTTRRVYKDAFPHEVALDIIRKGLGTQFDPDVVNAFLEREQEFRQVAADLADNPHEHVPLISAAQLELVAAE